VKRVRAAGATHAAALRRAALAVLALSGVALLTRAQLARRRLRGAAAPPRRAASALAPRLRDGPPTPAAAAPAQPEPPPAEPSAGTPAAARFAALVVRARVVVVVGWIAIAVAASIALPSIREAQVGALGDLVPAGADAIAAEERSAELFRFPLLSRTVVVAREADGLSTADHARVARDVVALDRGELPGLRETRGYLITNALGVAPLVRERSTTMLVPLLFPLSIGQNGRTGAAHRFAEGYVEPAAPGATAGVTGAIAARAEQADAISAHLPLVELATLVFVLVAVGLYFRAVVAPLVNLAAVALAYLISIRVVASLGRLVGVSVPSEVQPIVVALLFGVVTDYSLFFLSRFRRRLEGGEPREEAARDTTAELTPIILTCGIAVAAACGVLVVAQLGFLQAFGPGMAMAVLIALVVSMTFIPATLALLGNRLFWPHVPSRANRSTDAAARRGVARRVVGAAVRAPRRTIAACLVILAAMGCGVGWLRLGNPLIRGLPPDSSARVAYEQASRGFVAGILSPSVLVVEQPAIATMRPRLAHLQRLLARQPGVAEVVGPASNPTRLELGAALASSGDAARYVIVLKADPLGAGAIERIRRLQRSMPALLARAGLGGARVSFAGDTALSRETIDGTVDDLLRVVPAVLLAVLLVLVAFLRGLVAPLYLVVAAAIAPLAAVGLAVALFQGVLGQGEISYYVPVAAGVLLVALGSDYNIFLVGRVWDEAQRRPLAEAITLAGAGAARAISAAGIVLAVSFGALALVPVSSFRELAFVMAVGLLIDAFVVRTILIPAVISLVGYRSGWPGHRLRRHVDREGRLHVRDLPAGAPRRAGARAA
jgi:RND superfamily putative drug exporter